MLAHHLRGRRCTPDRPRPARGALHRRQGPWRFCNAARAHSPCEHRRRSTSERGVDSAIVMLRLLSNEQLDPCRPAATLHLTWRSPLGACVSHVLSLTLHGGSDARPMEIAIDQAVVAGWTGRDAAAVEKHIKELEALGVKRPATTPIFYRVSAARLTTGDAIEAVGLASGGEVEFVLLQHAGRLWVGTGSDHTDREVEKYGVTVSKQMCDKPMAPTFWPFDEVAPHWDRLTLRAHVMEGGRRVLYQEGPVTAMLDPRTLITGYAADGRLADGTLMFCGTLAARGGVRATNEFAFELEDPVRGRKISHAYRVK